MSLNAGGSPEPPPYPPCTWPTSTGSPADGAKTTLYCAASEAVARESGQYYDDCRRKVPGPAATPALAGALWERSAGWVASS